MTHSSNIKILSNIEIVPDFKIVSDTEISDIESIFDFLIHHYQFICPPPPPSPCRSGLFYE